MNVGRDDISHGILAIKQDMVRNYPSPPASFAAITAIDKHRFPIGPIDNERLLQSISLDIEGELIELLLLHHRKRIRGGMYRNFKDIDAHRIAGDLIGARPLAAQFMAEAAWMD